MTRSRLLLGWTLVGLLLLVAVGMFACSFPASGDKLPVLQEEEAVPSTALPGKRQTFLVMGADERPGDAGRSDTVMLVSWDPQQDRIGILSLPRDLWVQIPGYGYDKLNHSFAYGGEQLMVATVERFLGVTIDHYVVVNFNGFRKVIDAVGGVEIDVEKRLYYEDPYDPDGPLVINLYPGLQRLDGAKALHYARFRADESGDIGRMQRQQTLLKALAAEVLKPANVGRIPAVVKNTAAAIRTDLSVADMVKMAAQGLGALKQPMTTGTISGRGDMLGGVFYLVVDIPQARTEAYRLLTGEEPDQEFLALAAEAQATYAAAWRQAKEAEPPPQQPADGDGESSEPPADGAPGEDPPAEENPPGEETPPDAENPPGQDPPDGETPPDGEKPPGEAPPGVDPPVEDPPVEDPPVEDPPGEDPPDATPPPPPPTG